MVTRQTKFWGKGRTRPSLPIVRAGLVDFRSETLTGVVPVGTIPVRFRLLFGIPQPHSTPPCFVFSIIQKMEKVEERLLLLCQRDTQLFLGKRNVTTNGESVPRYCLFLIPWRHHCAAVKIKIDWVAPPDCNGYVFYFCSSVESVICHSKISGLKARTKTTVEKALRNCLPQVYLKFDDNVSVSLH
jgi:hypothetical protein